MRTWTQKTPGLSRYRAEELQRFCWQYREKRARAAAAGSGAEAQRQAQRDRRELQLIEECAMEAAGGCEALYVCLIANVCDRVGYSYLDAPQGINQFSATKRRFFALLDQKR